MSLGQFFLLCIWCGTLVALGFWTWLHHANSTQEGFGRELNLEPFCCEVTEPMCTVLILNIAYFMNNVAATTAITGCWDVDADSVAAPGFSILNHNANNKLKLHN